MDAAVDAVLTMLGKHGAKMDSLPGAETIIVAMRLNPDARSRYANDFWFGRNEDRPPGGTRSFVSVQRNATRSAKSKHVVVCIDKASLERLGERASDPVTLRREATVTIY